MKSKGIRDMILFSLIGILVLGTLIFLATRQEGNLPAYSVLNQSPQGYSVYLETLKKLGIDARQGVKNLDQQSVGSVQIVAYPWWFDTTDPAMIQWVEGGGILVLAAPEPLVSIEGSQMVQEENGVKLYTVKAGHVLTIPAASLTNRVLAQDTLASWTLTTQLMKLGKQPVLFNETALFPDAGKRSLWGATPKGVKLLLYQLLITIGVWFWMKGSQLGKPLPFTAETERTELEYLKAAAHFFQAAGCGQLMLGIYFKSLTRALGCKESDWLDHWRSEGLPELQRAEQLGAWLGKVPRKSTYKELQQQILMIEHLKDIVINRRQILWAKQKHQ